MTLTPLPPRRIQLLSELLLSIPPHQKRLSLDTWLRLLGKLRSMALALPGARGLFSHLQQAIHSRQGTRLRLTPAFHQALEDFRWLATHLGSRPTRLQELVPSEPSVVGAHDASGLGAGGILLPHPSVSIRQQPLLTLSASTAVPRTRWTVPSAPVPIVWRNTFPLPIREALISFTSPHGTINNSELELAGAFYHEAMAAQCFDLRKRTIKSLTDNTATLFWTRRGSATLLRQRAHSLTRGISTDCRPRFVYAGSPRCAPRGRNWRRSFSSHRRPRCTMVTLGNIL